MDVQRQHHQRLVAFANATSQINAVKTDLIYWRFRYNTSDRSLQSCHLTEWDQCDLRAFCPFTAACCGVLLVSKSSPGVWTLCSTQYSSASILGHWQVLGSSSPLFPAPPFSGLFLSGCSAEMTSEAENTTAWTIFWIEKKASQFVLRHIPVHWKLRWLGDCHGLAYTFLVFLWTRADHGPWYWCFSSGAHLLRAACYAFTLFQLDADLVLQMLKLSTFFCDVVNFRTKNRSPVSKTCSIALT